MVSLPCCQPEGMDKEANSLSHCVWTYGKGHANGEYAIFFIRRCMEPGKPYYTLQLDEKTLTVKQNRGDHHSGKTQKVQAFEDLWIAWVKAGARRGQDGKPILPGNRKIRSA